MKLLNLLMVCTVIMASCKKNDTPEFFVNEDPSTFKEIGSIGIGGVGAAEISAYDPLTQRLFVVNNSATNKIDVLDIKNNDFSTAYFFQSKNHHKIGN